MSKPKYVRLKDLAKLAKKYPDAVLAYPVDADIYDFSNRLAGEFHDELIEMHSDYTGRGLPKYRHVVILK